MDYVLCFAFDKKLYNVLLIKKNRPAWQRGKYNGIGGKIETDEKAKEAASREFFEEAGISIDNEKWKDGGVYTGKGFKVYIFWVLIDYFPVKISDEGEIAKVNIEEMYEIDTVTDVVQIVQYIRKLSGYSPVG